MYNRRYSMDYKKLASDVVKKATYMLMNDKTLKPTVRTMEESIEKYGVKLSAVEIELAGDDVDYKKMLWQIITDLRLSANSNYDYDMEAYHNDDNMLHEITSIIEKQTDEFNQENLGFINISRIDCDDYEEISKEKDLL